MATTATITLASADIAGDPVNVSKTATCTKAEGDNLAAKVYVINKATDPSLYLTITINAQTVGKLYGGDWMFIPWSQTDTSASIEVAATNWSASTGDIPVEYALFHEDTDFLTNA